MTNKKTFVCVVPNLGICQFFVEKKEMWRVETRIGDVLTRTKGKRRGICNLSVHTKKISDISNI